MQDLAGVQISMVERCSRTVNCFELVSFPLFFALSYMNMNPVWLETCTLGGTGSMLFLHNSGGEAARGLEEAILNFSKVTMLRVVFICVLHCLAYMALSKEICC